MELTLSDTSRRYELVTEHLEIHSAYADALTLYVIRADSNLSRLLKQDVMDYAKRARKEALSGFGSWPS